MRPVRSYTDADREAVRVSLAMHGGNLHAVARETGIPFSTVHGWARKPVLTGVDALPAPVIEAATELVRLDKRGEVIAAAWNLAAAGFKRAEEALPQAGAQAAAIVAGIAVDKAQLLSGGATSRAEVKDTTPVPDPDSIATILTILSEAGVLPHVQEDGKDLRLLGA